MFQSVGYIDAESKRGRMRLGTLPVREQLNFLLTNRIPRRLATLLVGRLSNIESPVVTKGGIAVWRFFAGDFQFDEAETTEFKSLQDCFTRKLKPTARPIDPDPDVLVSPCDGIVVSCGDIRDEEVLQAKGYPYTLTDLLGEDSLIDRYRDGVYVTLRLTSTMYHRFHSPAAGRISRVVYISGDTWNVNPIALKRIERLYCKNERAVIEIDLDGSERSVTLVPIAAILVASIRLHFLETVLDLKYRGPNVISCSHSFEKGEELGFFQHGSTIAVFAERGCRLSPEIVQGQVVRMGQALLRGPGC